MPIFKLSKTSSMGRPTNNITFNASNKEGIVRIGLVISLNHFGDKDIITVKYKLSPNSNN